MSVVSVHHLSKSYGHVQALQDVTFDIGEGVTGLLGPNGAGKSTLLLCVLGLLVDWRGEVTVLGRDVRADGLEVRRRVGFMPELDAYLPEMSAIRAVRQLGRLAGLPRAEALRRAHEVLWHVGLGEAVYRDVREYSVGMRQRFKLAQALVHDPEVLFLDEPLGGLDPGGRDELLDLVRDLASHHGKHVIWSSHILPEVQKVADQVAILHRGHFRGSLRISDLEGAAGTCLVEVDGDAHRLVEALVSRGASVNELPEVSNGELKGRRRFEVHLPSTLGPTEVLGLAHRAGARIRHLASRTASLEQAFQQALEAAERAEAPA